MEQNLTFLGITYGKHNVPPKIQDQRQTDLAGATPGWTPPTMLLSSGSRRRPNRITGLISNSLFPIPPIPPPLPLGPAPKPSRTAGIALMGFQLDSFPRRSGEIIHARFFYYGSRGQQLAKGQFVVSNPVRGSFSRWTPDPLPDAQSDGDLDVTLTNLDANAQSPYIQNNGAPRNDPLNKIVQLGFDVEQKGQSATNWRAIRVTASDATGNNATAWVNQNSEELACSTISFNPPSGRTNPPGNCVWNFPGPRVLMRMSFGPFPISL